MAVGLKVKREKDEEKERTPPLNPPFPWQMTPFPYAVAGVTSPPPKASLRPVPVDITNAGG